ncbi:MAG: helix-hairpin-helix domain-containing protein [Thermoplasmatota archaeon]
MRLTDVDGVGDALASRLIEAFGTEEAALDAAFKREVERLAAVEGVGEHRAIQLILHVHGRTGTDFLRTPRAEALYDDILDRIRAYASTDHGRARLRLLIPMTKVEEIRAHLDFVDEVVAEVRPLAREKVRACLSRIGRPRVPRPKFDGGIAILVDSDAEHERLIGAGLDRYCRVITPDDDLGSCELVVYAYSTGGLDVSGADHVVTIPFTTEVGELVPEAQLAFFRENRALWDALAELATLRGTSTAVTDVRAILERIEGTTVDFAPVEAIVRRAVDEMNQELTAKIASLSLSGDEIVGMMSGRAPKRLTQLQTDALRTAREKILRESGESIACFTDGFPVAIDEAALERASLDFAGRRRRSLFRDRVDAARRLTALRPAIEDEIEAALEFDYRLAVGSFVLDYDLHRPKFAPGLKVTGALHLNMRQPGSQGAAIDYELGGPHRVALLTGANSGGKTTLLETLAQIALLAHMGLPVPAKSATLEIVEGVYFFTQKRSLDAGAFESFLKGFVPIVTNPARKLVLADELEAMTELEAASRILGTFLRMLKETGSLGVCVTHMADEINRFVEVRMDGIEARGLDEELNLIVDRTPRMGYRARSTPELILRRLAAKSDGPERKIFEEILAEFPDRKAP